ncbi:thioredoxin [Insulibacter thermoxylanivorax]|uniref:Thioredoxin n=1 Tax=Insulibacter thermoxylanivorax TaxID=2749268 RepID=A0A916QEI5_9BACL|nr:thioredoxin [Insulibacter thermoxylanivorax]GFR37608.1 thioredoxin [Insulibacter thermoxylanivorax]
MTIVNATDQTLESVIKENRVVLVDFWAPWCGPCRMLAPILEDLDREMGDKVKIVKVNVDMNPVSAIKYQIQGIPALRLFVDGREVQNIVGVQPLHILKQMIAPYAAAV